MSFIDSIEIQINWRENLAYVDFFQPLGEPKLEFFHGKKIAGANKCRVYTDL